MWSRSPSISAPRLSYRGAHCQIRTVGQLAQEALPIQEAVNKAWEIRKKIVARVQAVSVSENLVKIWEATEEDVREGSTLGPFFDHEKVSEVVGTDRWIPTQRFEVVQKNKVRGCDSATTNLINPITVITEKLQLPSTDSNVAALRALRSLAPGEKLAGWVLDERKLTDRWRSHQNTEGSASSAWKNPARVGQLSLLW